MTVAEFFGCTCLAFGPPFAMFIFTVVHDPIRIIVLVAASFFWLVSILLSSIVWSILPISIHLEFAILYTVIFQEAFRFFIYKILRNTEKGLEKITENSATFVENKHILAYVSGLGFGIMSGAFSLLNVLADSIGPGTMGLRAGKETFFLTSASIGLCFILLNIFWSIIFFNACDNKNYLLCGYIVSSHLIASYLTLWNSQYSYWASITTLYVLLTFTGCLAFKVAGGTITSLRNGFNIKAIV